MAQVTGRSPEIEVPWSFPDGWELDRWENDQPIGTAPRFLPETKEPVLDKKGKPRFRKDNAGRKGGMIHTHVEPIQRVPIIGTKDKHGNVTWSRYYPPSPEDVAAAARRARLAKFREEFDEAAVDAGLSPSEVVAGMTGLLGQKPEPKKAEKKADNGEKQIDYPMHLQFGKYLLSDGEEIQGKEAAHEAEAALTGKPPPE